MDIAKTFILCALVMIAAACGSSSPSPVSEEGTGDGGENEDGLSQNCAANDAGNGSELISGPSGPSGEDFDQSFRSLVVDPVDPNIAFVGTERNGIFRTTDGGVTWSWLRQGIRHIGNSSYPEVWNMALSPRGSSDAVFAATLDSPGPVEGDYISSIGGVYKSSDGGITWQRSNCGLISSRATSIVFDPNNSSTLILGVEGGEASFSGYEGQYFDGGLFRSTDGGSNWTAVSLSRGSERNGYWHMFARGSSFYTFAFNSQNLSENLGFLKSADGGSTWTAFATELRGLFITNFDVSSDGRTIYANARDSFQVLKSTDGGGTWSTIASNANGPIKASPSNPDIVLFGGSSSLYRSADGLANSTEVINASNTIEDIEFAPSDPTVVYAAARGYDIYKSTDSGITWTRVTNLRTDVIGAQ